MSKAPGSAWGYLLIAHIGGPYRHHPGPSSWEFPIVSGAGLRNNDVLLSLRQRPHRIGWALTRVGAITPPSDQPIYPFDILESGIGFPILATALPIHSIPNRPRR